MRLRAIYTIYVILFSFNIGLLGQLSFKGQPHFGKVQPQFLNTEIPYISMPSFDLEMELKDVSANNPKELRFAHPFFVDLTFNNSGEWNILNDGSRVWRLGIHSKGAFSINLIFDQFNIPEGAKLFVYNNSRTHLKGAYTNESYAGHGVFAIEPIKSDSIIIEYNEPANAEYSGEIKIGAVNHDFKGILSNYLFKAGDFGDSESCQVDISCMPDIFLEKKSVCKLIIDGTTLCTGTLMNNSSFDGTPYVLTAGHCLDEKVNNHSFLCYFNYEVPNCNDFIEGDKSQTISGATIKARLDSLDFVLAEMNQMPPETYQPYWAGWSRASYPKAPYHVIHHPQGDVKKFGRCVYDFYASSYLPSYFYQDSHWRIPVWKTGTTEGGSSGCALFNEEGHVIGTLSGGAAICSNPINDYFSRFNKAWDYSSDSAKQLKYWLDPEETELVVIDGYDYYNNEFVRVTNFDEGDIPIDNDPYDSRFGNWLGQNKKGTLGFADMYPCIDSASVHGLYLMIGDCPRYTESTCRLRLWSESIFTEDATAVFDTVLVMKYLESHSENRILFDAPIKVKHPVSISVEYDFKSRNDSLGFYWQYAASRKLNTLYINNGEVWTPFYNIHPEGLNASAYIDLLTTNYFSSEKDVDPEDSELISSFYNPSTKSIHFKWWVNKLMSLEIYSLSGKRILDETYGYVYGDESLNVSNLAKGVYFIKFSFNSVSHAKSIVVY